MNISKVLSYKGAWEKFNQDNKAELRDILASLSNFVNNVSTARTISSRPYPLRDIWIKELNELGWSEVKKGLITEDGHRIYLSNLGLIKNKVSATLSFGHVDYLNRWLFQHTTLAIKYGVIDIPIMLLPVQEYAKRLDEGPMYRFYFEMYHRQLQPLTPLSHSYPFLILGYSDKIKLFDPEVFELESDLTIQVENIIIDRSIEFPPEYYQAGLGILSYFGTYIRENYPNEDANVKIEQNGKTVRLIIEAENGKKEIIEKALEEYQLIITGQQSPEVFTTNDKLVLELRNELRIAKYRVESQHDIIQVQNNRIDQLINIVGNGLTNKPSITIDVNPVITTNISSVYNQNISLALSNINELKDSLPVSGTAHLALNELQGSLEALEKETDPEKVRKSPAMSKYRRIIETITEGNNDMEKAIKAAENGWEIFKGLAGTYNKIAQWCGLPQVPSIFTK